MRQEALSLTRRDFLIRSGKFVAASALTLGTSLQVIETVSNLRQYEYVTRKTKLPLLKETIQENSMLTGIYPDKNNTHTVSNNNEFSIVGFFSNWQDWLGNGTIHNISPEQIPLISLSPSYQTGNVPFRYKDLVQEKAHIKTQALRVSPLYSCLLRFEYEMNGMWFPYGSNAQTPQEFIDGWKLVTEIVKEANPHIYMVWCPYVDYPIEEYYPGHDWVDIMALDGYNKYNPNLLHARHHYPNPTFSQLFGHDLHTLQDLNDMKRPKPILIGEVGIDPDNPISSSWIQQVFNDSATYKDVVGVCLFAWNKAKGVFDTQEADWGKSFNSNLREYLTQSSYYITTPERKQAWDILQMTA